MQRIYLDYNASTPIDPMVGAAMMPFFADHFGNPSSDHWAAAPAKAALEKARGQIAALLGCENDEVVFTSGGSEANNLALKGVYFARRDIGDHVITTRIEHPAIIEPCRFLERQGARITYLSVDRLGRVDPDDLSRAITPRTILISTMHANNEVGTIQPIEECARIAREHGVLFHTDAAQSVGKIATDVNGLGVDLLSIAGHKLYAPKGIGALYIRRGIDLPPLLLGAGQEHGRRPGTENVAYIVALGEACRIARVHLQSGMHELRSLADQFYAGLKREIPGVKLAGHPTQRLPNTLNVVFPAISGRRLLERCPGVLASNGSACHADSEEPSAILTTLGFSPEEALGTVRLSLGRGTTQADIGVAASHLVAAWRALAGTGVQDGLVARGNITTALVG